MHYVTLLCISTCKRSIRGSNSTACHVQAMTAKSLNNNEDFKIQSLSFHTGRNNRCCVSLSLISPDNLITPIVKRQASDSGIKQQILNGCVCVYTGPVFTIFIQTLHKRSDELAEFLSCWKTGTYPEHLRISVFVEQRVTESQKT